MGTNFMEQVAEYAQLVATSGVLDGPTNLEVVGDMATLAYVLARGVRQSDDQDFMQGWPEMSGFVHSLLVDGMGMDYLKQIQRSVKRGCLGGGRYI